MEGESWRWNTTPSCRLAPIPRHVPPFSPPVVETQVLDSSPHASLALDLMKQQEATKAQEHRKNQAEYEAYMKQMEVRESGGGDIRRRLG